MTSVGSVGATIDKSHLKEWLFCLFAAYTLAGCSREVALVTITGATMGTTWGVSYVEPAQAVDPDRLWADIQALLDDVNRSMSTYQDDSEINAFNRSPPEDWVQVSPAFLQVLQAALEVGERSEGAYDVTVAPLVDLWGFGPGKSVDTVPAEEEIAARMQRVGQQHLRVDGDEGRVMKRIELSLDFSSLAKGHAVDRIAALLEQRGIERFMVEVGGEMRLSGQSGRGDPWRIAIEQPDGTLRAVAAAMSLTDVAIATSGDYRNYFEAEGRRYSHVIDPRTGLPVAHDLVSVTVVHPECMLADAWATALVVLGAERAMAVAQEHGLAVYFIRRAGDEFVHSHTPSFSGYLAGPAVQGGA
jgi:thiamine biosynthesis lipoprotein